MVFMTLANSVLNAKPYSFTGQEVVRNRLTPAPASVFWSADR